MNTITLALQKLKFEYSSLVAREPLLMPLYKPVVWWQKYKVWRNYSHNGASTQECSVDRDTEFIIDGFQGSANSYAADAFKRSQRTKVLMAHHMHSPAQIIRGIKFDIPTLVTIRDPIGATLSLTSRWPYVSMRQALRGYIRFYGKLEPYMNECVLSPFDLTTSQLEVAIRAVNEKYGTNFDISRRAVEQMRQRHETAKKDPEEKRRRDVLKEKKEAELKAPTCEQLLNRATTMHQRMQKYSVDTQSYR